jgi:hypothetical protein
LKTIAGSLDSLTVFHTGINTVAPIDAQYLWSDKYQPRKPRIFNKVYTMVMIGINILKSTMIQISKYHTNIVHLKLLVKDGIIQIIINFDVIFKMKYFSYGFIFVNGNIVEKLFFFFFYCFHL